MTLAETIVPGEKTSDDALRPVMAHVSRRGYAWALALGIWTEEHHKWFTDRRCSPSRMVSDDVRAFLWAFNGEFEEGQIAIRPFDHRRDVTTNLPFHQAADWFGGLVSEVMQAN